MRVNWQWSVFNMTIIHQVVVMLITLGVLVTIHEYGHYWVARKCGVKVLRFSIGFGPILYRWKNKQETEFALSLLPLGGYVKMLDEREETVDTSLKHQAFNNKSAAQRIAIVSAGPLANFALAIIVYWFVFLQGVTGLAPTIYSIANNSVAEKAGLQVRQQIISIDGVLTPTANAVALQLMERLGDNGVINIDARRPNSDAISHYQLPIQQWLREQESDIDLLGSLGIGFYQPVIEPIVEEVISGSAAEQAGLKAGDKLLSADGESINDWFEWVAYVRERANRIIEIKIVRSGQIMTMSITPIAINDKNKVIGQVGVRVKVPPTPSELLMKEEYNLITAFKPALQRTWQASFFSLQALKKMIVGDISYKQLSGPITIAKVASESANSGIYSYLSLLALLSVSLGVLNLLPIPVLDGGHIFFYTIEWVRGAPISEKIQQFAYQFGMLVVLSVMVLALFNDFSRL
jgi:regulator of sigma E protease